MPSCPQCGNTEPDEAQWCGKCFLPFAPSPAVQGFSAPVMPVAAPPAVPAQYAAPPAVPAQYAAPVPPAPTTAVALDAAGWAAPAGPPPTDGAPPPLPSLPPPAWGAAAAPPWGYQPGSPGPDATAEGRLVGGRAVAMVAISIGLGIVMQGIAYVLSRDSSRNIDSLIRWDIVLTVVQYAVVAAIVLSQITPKVKLRWGPGSPVVRAAVGAAIGLGGGGLILLVLHAATGTLTSDPRVVLLMSGGDTTRIVAAVALTCIAAPLVEEVLFRGLLLESLRQYNVGMALVVSAMFFAVWHLNRRALIYYTLMGCIFGGLYIKRGLVASMTAHFCFNGALTIAAVVIVLGPGHTFQADGLKVTLPAGWTDESTAASAEFGEGAPDLALQGPDASLIAVSASSELDGRVFDPNAVAQRLSSSDLGDTGSVRYDPNSVHQVDLPAVGRAVVVNFMLGALGGEDVLFAANGQVCVVRFVNGGSSKANADFTKMLNTLQLSS